MVQNKNYNNRGRISISELPVEPTPFSNKMRELKSETRNWRYPEPIVPAVLDRFHSGVDALGNTETYWVRTI